MNVYLAGFRSEGCRRTSDTVANRSVCAIVKTYHQPPPAASQGYAVIPDVIENISIDFVWPLVLSNHGNQWLMVITYNFSRWCEVYPLRDEKEYGVCNMPC